MEREYNTKVNKNIKICISSFSFNTTFHKMIQILHLKASLINSLTMSNIVLKIGFFIPPAYKFTINYIVIKDKGLTQII